VAVDCAEMGAQTRTIPSPGLGYEVETAVGVYESHGSEKVYIKVLVIFDLEKGILASHSNGFYRHLMRILPMC
jgi:hypothetical protein